MKQLQKTFEDNSTEKCIELLKRRGFLIEQSKGKYYLSDNSHSFDESYLDKILKANELGYIDSKHCIIIEQNKPEMLMALFEPNPKGMVGTGSNNRIHKWYKLKKHNCADKIPVNCLEANIARYIKALSACGIYTGGCCDGNHPGVYEMCIEFDGPIYQEFHKCLWKMHLSAMFDLKWKRSYSVIDISGDKQKQYDELNKAAIYLYDNREFFRNIRKESARWLNKRIEENSTREELAERFISEVERYLEKEDFEDANRL